MIVPTEEKAWIQSNNYGARLEGEGHLTAEVILNKASWKGTLPQKKGELKKKEREGEEKALRVKRSQWFWHISPSTFQSLCLLPILATSQNF